MHNNRNSLRDIIVGPYEIFSLQTNLNKLLMLWCMKGTMSSY
jgi:hypothetical protein